MLKCPDQFSIKAWKNKIISSIQKIEDIRIYIHPFDDECQILISWKIDGDILYTRITFISLFDIDIDSILSKMGSIELRYLDVKHYNHHLPNFLSNQIRFKYDILSTNPILLEYSIFDSIVNDISDDFDLNQIQSPYKIYTKLINIDIIEIINKIQNKPLSF